MMTSQCVIDDLAPSGEHAYLIPAWLSFLHYAIGNPEIVAQFREDTGNRWQPGRGGMDRLIDGVSGVEAEFFRSFATWVNENLWGDPGEVSDCDPRHPCPS